MKTKKSVFIWADMCQNSVRQNDQKHRGIKIDGNSINLAITSLHLHCNLLKKVEKHGKILNFSYLHTFEKLYEKCFK